MLYLAGIIESSFPGIVCTFLAQFESFYRSFSGQVFGLEVVNCLFVASRPVTFTCVWIEVCGVRFGVLPLHELLAILSVLLLESAVCILVCEGIVLFYYMCI